MTGPILGDGYHGAIGSSLLFDGVDDFLTTGYPHGLNIVGKITLEAWINIEAAVGIRNIIVHNHSAEPIGEVYLRVRDGYYETGSWDGNPHRVQYAIPVEDYGDWVHLVGVYDGSAWRLYRNGSQVDVSSDSTGAVSVSENWGIGSRGTGTERFFKGRIDEVRTYDDALSNEIITQHYSETMASIGNFYNDINRLTQLNHIEFL